MTQANGEPRRGIIATLARIFRPQTRGKDELDERLDEAENARQRAMTALREHAWREQALFRLPTVGSALPRPDDPADAIRHARAVRNAR